MIPELGKYAGAVLSAYGASLALIAGVILVSIRSARRARTELRNAEARRNG